MRVLSAFDQGELVREIAFGLLLTRQRPITLAELSAASGMANLGPMLEALTDAGWVDRGIDGSVTGSAGLTLGSAPHALTIAGTTFRTWCAYDALGIPAALRENATVDTACGVCATPITLSIVSGQPE